MYTHGFCINFETIKQYDKVYRNTKSLGRFQGSEKIKAIIRRIIFISHTNVEKKKVIREFRYVSKHLTYQNMDDTLIFYRCLKEFLDIRKLLFLFRPFCNCLWNSILFIDFFDTTNRTPSPSLSPPPTLIIVDIYEFRYRKFIPL